VIPSPRDDLPALLVRPHEIFGEIHVLFGKSHGRPWGNEILVPIANAQVVLRIEDPSLC
jgi:hypothetical protein